MQDKQILSKKRFKGIGMHLQKYENRIWATTVAMAPIMLSEKMFSLRTFESERRILISSNLKFKIKYFRKFDAK